MPAVATTARVESSRAAIPSFAVVDVLLIKEKLWVPVAVVDALAAAATVMFTSVVIV